MEVQSSPCDSLAEVRERIDALDAQIIALLAERGALVKQAARFKADAAAVAAPARVERVIVGVRTKAEAAGLDPVIAEATYRAMIGAFIAAEREEHARLRAPQK